MSFRDFNTFVYAFFKECPVDTTVFIFYRGYKKQINLNQFTDPTSWEPWLDEVDQACKLSQETFADNEILTGFIAFKCCVHNGLRLRVL